MSLLHFGPYRVETSREDKILFGDEGFSKGDLIAYYRDIAKVMLPFLKDRPLMLQRFPDGIEKEGFYQKEIPDYFPDWLRREKVKKAGGFVNHALCNNAASLVYLADQACLTFHAWLSRRDRLDYPDLMIFDLDPGNSDFAPVRQASFLLRDLLAELGLDAFVMTTGSSGLHVRVPLLRKIDFDGVRATAREIAARVVACRPDTYTMEQRVEKRRGRLFIDTNRNAYAQTAVAPYSVRPYPSAPVATPLHWEELKDESLDSRTFTITDIPDRLAHGNDPWKNTSANLKSLKQTMRILEIPSG